MTDSLMNQQTDQDQISIDENKDYYSELVGEGKKFKDNAELAKGKWYADQMVALQNKRLDQLRQDFLAERQENIAKAKLQDYVDRLVKTPNDSETPPAKLEQEKPAITEDQIKTLLSSSLKEYEATKRQSENLSKVQEKLIEKFGANYASSYSDQLQALGLSPAQVDNLAKESPQAAIQLLGLNAPKSQESFQSPPRSNQRSDNFTSGNRKRTWDYYQQLKKSDPNLYFDPKIATQMMDDAAELGDAFYDGNFHAKGKFEK